MIISEQMYSGNPHHGSLNPLTAKPFRTILLTGLLCLLLLPVSAWGEYTRVYEGEGNPLEGINVGIFSAPTFGDIDRDGDADLLIGTSTGTIYYFENTGSAESATFTERTDGDNPFASISGDTHISPVLVDINGNGDIDTLVTGNSAGTLRYFEITESSGTIEVNPGTVNPFEGITVEFYSAPAFADIDGDGDQDLFVGKYGSYIDYYKNAGTSAAPSYPTTPTQQIKADAFNNEYRLKPAFSKIDKDDEKIDMIIGNDNGSIFYFQNTSVDNSSVQFEKRIQSSDNPFNSFSGLTFGAPAFVDINGDGDEDIFIGMNTGNIAFIRNGVDTCGKGDVDCSGTVDLADAILALRVLVDATTDDENGNIQVNLSDVNGDGSIGLEEVIYILRDIATN
ncbi:VCBS repeat-containing protein [Desulfonema ishimotonii]|uniref:VCBS repeat-containing protein n=1 Tax=Desulfonema ishimotonii TaxID=45657 RepID=A0A401G3N8_9BACT|nr:FG-GAP-like repeat-containing protein [Desulfonema ishimotonii]GBC63834.1 VCBS repeat-containing protein [Desulfonema ishimotonii]